MSDLNPTVCSRCGAAVPADAPKGLCPRCVAAMNLATETVLTGADAAAAQPPLTPEKLQPHLPQFEIIECLGRGGMGVVYKARQKSLDRIIALKLLAPERVGDEDFAKRFTTEAHALARLNHPNIVTVHDFGQAGSFFYLAMEFVDGVNLRELLRAGKLKPKEALSIVPPVCEALQFAHEHGIVHRDIKPENLLLSKDGQVKIADFGIAKIMGSSIGAATEPQVAGTPQYMAPEQRAGGVSADHRADIYSLGVVLYELLTGDLPDDKLLPPSRRVTIDVRLDEIVLRALQKTPELRFQTAGEFRTQVETLLKGKEAPNKEARKPSSSRTVWIVIGAIIALVLLVIIIPVAGYLMLFTSYMPRHQPRVESQATPSPPVSPRESQPNTVLEPHGRTVSTNILRIQLEQAELDLSRLLALQEKNLISSEEVSKAILTREVLRAAMEGDSVKVAKVRVEHAERELSRLEKLREQNLVAAVQVEKAIYLLKLRQAELNELRQVSTNAAPGTLE